VITHDHRVVAQAQGQGVASDEHFTVSLDRRSPQKFIVGLPGSSGGSEGLFSLGWKLIRLPQVSNSVPSTQESKTDPDALLARKGRGKESKLSYSTPKREKTNECGAPSFEFERSRENCEVEQSHRTA